MTSELLAGIAGIVLSLVFSYMPGLNVKFAQLEGDYKRLIMLGTLVLVGGASFGLSCADLWPTVACDQAGAMQLVEAFIFAAIANQSAYQLSPETQAVKEAKADRHAVG